METQHPTIAKLDLNEKSLKAARLKKSLGKEQQFFKVFDNKNAKAINGSFQILKVSVAPGKCFTDGEFEKKCMLLVVSKLCPEKVRMF